MCVTSTRGHWGRVDRDVQIDERRQCDHTAVCGSRRGVCSLFWSLGFSSRGPITGHSFSHLRGMGSPTLRELGFHTVCGLLSAQSAFGRRVLGDSAGHGAYRPSAERWARPPYSSSFWKVLAKASRVGAVPGLRVPAPAFPGLS